MKVYISYYTVYLGRYFFGFLDANFVKLSRRKPRLILWENAQGK